MSSILDEAEFTRCICRFQSQIDVIYKKLIEIFEGPGLTNRALQAIKLIAPLSEETATTARGYELFQALMQAPASEVSSEEKWEVSRLALHKAFKWDRDLPSVENPQGVLNFLNHHFSLATNGSGNHDEPIQNALRVLGSVSGPVMNEALKRFNPTQSSFVRGICFAFEGSRPAKLREAAFFFLPLIADIWFNTHDPIMKPDQMKIWCEDWASAADDAGATNNTRTATLTILFNMINSTHWRPHIVVEKWKLLKHFISDPGDSEPLRRCLRNPDLIDAIPNVGNPGARVLWLAVLWSKCEQLTLNVRTKLETATGEVSMMDLDVCLSAVDPELEKVEGELLGYETWSTDPVFVGLGEKKHSLEKAKKFLMTLKRG